MLVEARVLCRDGSVLEIGRDLAERNEVVALVIGFAVNPGLHAALHVDSGRGWVDPPEGEKRERGKRPGKGDADGEPFKNGSEREFPRWGAGGRVWDFSHTFRIIGWGGMGPKAARGVAMSFKIHQARLRPIARADDGLIEPYYDPEADSVVGQSFIRNGC